MAKLNVDFTNVEDKPLLPVGSYICKVTKIEVTDGEKAKNLKWEATVGVGPHKGAKIFFNTSLAPKALFRLREVLVNMGFNVPKSAVAIDTDKYVGRIIGLSVIMGEYNGRPKNEMSASFKPEKNQDGTWKLPSAENKAKKDDDLEDAPFDAGLSSDDSEVVEEIEI
jgi:hypothetical protein